MAFHKSNAIDGRLTTVEDIAPIYKFLCTDGAWINGEFSSVFSIPNILQLKKTSILTTHHQQKGQTLFANGGYTSR